MADGDVKTFDPFAGGRQGSFVPEIKKIEEMAKKKAEVAKQDIKAEEEQANKDNEKYAFSDSPSSPGVITEKEQSELDALRVKMLDALGDRNEGDIPVHPDAPEDPYWTARRNWQLAYKKSLEE